MQRVPLVLGAIGRVSLSLVENISRRPAAGALDLRGAESGLS
jgi:hypothetical protein